MNKIYCVMLEIRGNYEQWIQIFEGEYKEKEKFLANGKIKIDAEFKCNKSILNEPFKIEDLNMNLKGEITGYNDNRVYYYLNEISEDEVNTIIKAVTEKNNSKDEVTEEIQKVGKQDSINDYMKLLNKLTNEGLNEEQAKELLKQIKIFNNKQLMRAKETGKKQLTSFEMGMTEYKEKGYIVKEEFIHPDGKMEKVKRYSNDSNQIIQQKI